MRTSSSTEGRNLAHVTHLQAAMTLFMCMTTAKGYAMLYTAHEACNTRVHSDADQSRCSPMRWMNCTAVGVFGYITYVAMLAYQRLAQHYVVAGTMAATSARKTAERPAVPAADSEGTDSASSARLSLAGTEDVQVVTIAES